MAGLNYFRPRRPSYLKSLERDETADPDGLWGMAFVAGDVFGRGIADRSADAELAPGAQAVGEFLGHEERQRGGAGTHIGLAFDHVALKRFARDGTGEENAAVRTFLVADPHGNNA